MDFQVASVQTKKGKEVATELVKLGFVVHCYREYEMEVKEQHYLKEKQVLQDKNEVLQGERQVLQGENEVLQQEKQSLEGENTSLLKCRADLSTDHEKDLTLKMVMILDEEMFVVIGALKRHTDVYQKKYEHQFRGPKKIVAFKQHLNPMSKWAKLRKLLADDNKIEKVHSMIYSCVNNYTLDQLLKDPKKEHKQQCIIVVSENRTINLYLKQKPVLHPALIDHNYCKPCS